MAPPGAPPWGGDGPPPGAIYGGPGAHPQYSGATTNGLAIVSLVLGITWCWGITGVAALVMGYLAKSQIDASRGRQTGRGLAIAGIVLGWISVGIAVLAVVLALIGSATSSS